jgi:tellurite methyltransferase
MPSLQDQFGHIDIYLFDQLLRGNVVPGMRVLDAGCGSGRNLVYLLGNGYEIFGVDQNFEAIAETRSQASALVPNFPVENLRHELIESISFPEASFDVVLCNAVLHFSRDDAHFLAMLHSLWRVLKPGGLLFCRLASTIGMPHRHIAERYCVDETFLMSLTAKLGGQLIDPIKTTVVQNQRCMTTWVVRKLTP